MTSSIMRILMLDDLYTFAYRRLTAA